MTETYKTQETQNKKQKILTESISSISQDKHHSNSQQILTASLMLKQLLTMIQKPSVLYLIRNQLKICRMFLYCQRVVIIDVCCISNISYRTQQKYLMLDNQTNFNKEVKYPINKKPEKIHEECKKNFEELYKILKNFKLYIQTTINTNFFQYYQYMVRVFDKTVKKYLYSIREQTQREIQKGDTQLVNKNLFLDNLLKIHEDFIAVFKYKSNNDLMSYQFGSRTINKEKQVSNGQEKSKYKNQKMKKIFGCHSKNYAIDSIKKILNSRLVIDQYHKLFKSYNQITNEVEGQKFPKQMSNEQIKLRKKIKKSKRMFNMPKNINLMIKLFSQNQQNSQIYKYMEKKVTYNNYMIQKMQQTSLNLTYSFCSSNCWNCIQCFHKNVQILPQSNFFVPPPTKILNNKFNYSQNTTPLSKLIKSPQKPYTIKTITAQQIQNKLILSSKICQIFNHGCGYLYIGINTISKNSYKYLQDGQQNCRIYDRYVENQLNSMKSQNSPSSSLQNSYIYIPTGIDITIAHKQKLSTIKNNKQIQENQSQQSPNQSPEQQPNQLLQTHKKIIINLCRQSIKQNLQPQHINYIPLTTIFDKKYQEYFQVSYIPVLELSTIKSSASASASASTNISKPIKNRYIIKIFINLHNLKTQQIFYLKPKTKKTKILQNIIFASEEQYLYDKDNDGHSYSSRNNGLNQNIIEKYMIQKDKSQKQQKQLIKYWDVIKDKLLGQNNYLFILSSFDRYRKWVKNLKNSQKSKSLNQQPSQQISQQQQQQEQEEEHEDYSNNKQSQYNYITKYIYTESTKKQINDYIRNCKHYPIKCYQEIKVNVNGLMDEGDLEDSSDGSLVVEEEGKEGGKEIKEGKQDKSKQKSQSKIKSNKINKNKNPIEIQLNKHINKISSNNKNDGSELDIFNNYPTSPHATSSMNNNLNQEYNSGYVQSYEQGHGHGHGHGQMGSMPGYQWQPYWQPYIQHPYIAPGGINQVYVQNYMGYMQNGYYQQGYQQPKQLPTISHNLPQLQKLTSQIPQKQTKDFGTLPKSITQTTNKHNSLMIISESGFKNGIKNTFTQKLNQRKIKYCDYPIFQKLEKYRCEECKRTIIFITHTQKYQELNRIVSQSIDKQKRHLVLMDIRNQFSFQQKNKQYTQILLQLQYQYRQIFPNKIQFGRKQQQIKTNSKITPIKIQTTYYLKLNNWIQASFCYIYLEYQNIRCTFVNYAKLEGVVMNSL